MVDNKRGTEGDADGFGGSPADEDPVDLLADAEAEDTATVVQRLRESGPHQHVSAESVDDVLAELDGDGSATDDGGVGRESHSESDNADSETSSGLVGGGPTTTVSQEGIDEVFEKLEAETPGRGDDADGIANDAAVDVARTDDEPTADDADPTDAQSGGSSTDDGFGTLAGGGPTTTVSDESVDDILSQVSDDVDYATFDGEDAPEIAAETEVDPDAVFPADWDTDDADEDADAVPEPDEHSPDEDADDLRPDDDAVLDLFADVAEEVNEGSSSVETPDEQTSRADGPDVDLTEAAGRLFEDEAVDDELVEDDAPDADADSIADDFEATGEFAMADDGVAADDDAEGESDGLDPSLADEVDALLSAADDVDAGTESETRIDSLDDAEAQREPGATSVSQAQQDASTQPERNEEPASDSSSQLALNTSDDTGVEWSEGGGDDEQAWVPLETSESGVSDSHDDGDTTPEESEADGDRHDDQSDERSFAGLRYARAAAGWLRSLLARLA